MSLSSTGSWPRGLVSAACRPYLRAGPGLFAYCFAWGKLRGDPVYRAILERGLLLGRPHILDLGCGQALLTAWLRAAARTQDSGRWPDHWPAAPRPLSIRGVELMARDVERARRALGPDIQIETGDIRELDFGKVDAVVALDVLHYMAPGAQRDVLNRARKSLSTGGLFLLRVSDAESGLRHRYSHWVDTVVMAARGHGGIALHCHGVAEWQSILRESGFESEVQPMSQGTPFSNVLLVAHAR